MTERRRGPRPGAAPSRWSPAARWSCPARRGRDIAAAGAELRHDVQAVRLALAELRLGVAHAGADPLRPSRRVNPRPRYRAMEQHFAATGRAAPGAVMMNSTAALQVNLEAGPRRGWPERVARAHRLGPTLVAISASSPWLHGRDTGWKSARQRAWAGPGPAGLRAGARLRGAAARPPTTAWTRPSAWARYALGAPVAFVRDGRRRGRRAVPARRPVRAVGQRHGPAGPPGADRRRPRHPPDHAVPAGPAARLPGAALPGHDRAPVVAGHRRGRHHAHGRPGRGRPGHRGDRARPPGCGPRPPATGWATPPLADSARRCLAIAASRVPAELAPAVADLAELVESGRCPGRPAGRAASPRSDPLAAFEELAHA